MDFNVLEVTFSYKEEMSAPPESQETKSSKVECWLVAHAIYSYLGTQSTIEDSIYLIATKTYDDEGYTSVNVNTSALPTKDEILSQLNTKITKKINSDIAELDYRHAIKEKLAESMKIDGLLLRDSQTGLSYFS